MTDGHRPPPATSPLAAVADEPPDPLTPADGPSGTPTPADGPRDWLTPADRQAGIPVPADEAPGPEACGAERSPTQADLVDAPMAHAPWREWASPTVLATAFFNEHVR